MILLFSIIGISLVILVILLILSVTTTPNGIERSEKDLQLKVSCLIRAPIKNVWALWTTDGGAPPFGGKEMIAFRVDPKPGGQWCFRSKARGFPAACGKVLSIQEPNWLELSFKACDLIDKPHRMLLEFRSVPEGTQSTITMDHFESKTRSYGRFQRANAILLASMRAELEGGNAGWQATIYSVVFFDVMGRLFMKFMKKSRSCHPDTDYLGDLEITPADSTNPAGDANL